MPVLYIVLGSVMMLVLLLYKPLYTWPGLLIVAVGIPVYFVWRGVRGVAPYPVV